MNTPRRVAAQRVRADRLVESIQFEKSKIHQGMTVKIVSRMYGDRRAAFEAIASAKSCDTNESFVSPLIVSYVFNKSARKPVKLV